METSSSRLGQPRSDGVTLRPAYAEGSDPIALPAARAQLAVILQRDGLHSGLAFLNARTRHRFTGVYRFASPMLVNVALFDRENPSLRVRGDIHLLTETYCRIVQELREPFVTADARRDSRLSAHPARKRIVSYCGVPLSRSDDAVYGVLCHHDPRPRVALESEVRFLESVAPLLYQAMIAAGESRA